MLQRVVLSLYQRSLMPEEVTELSKDSHWIQTTKQTVVQKGYYTAKWCYFQSTILPQKWRNNLIPTAAPLELSWKLDEHAALERIQVPINPQNCFHPSSLSRSYCTFKPRGPTGHSSLVHRNIETIIIVLSSFIAPRTYTTNRQHIFSIYFAPRQHITTLTSKGEQYYYANYYLSP